MTIEQYLDLTDEDIQELMSLNAGEAISSPFFASAINGRIISSDDDEDSSIDYQEDHDEPLLRGSTNSSAEDFPEFPGEIESEYD